MPDDIEIGGVLPEIPDERDLLAGEVADFLNTPLEELPESIRFDPQSARLESQGNTVQCTAHSATNALEATFYAQAGVPIRIDAAQQWEYQTKVYPKTSVSTGDYLASALKALLRRSEVHHGIPAIETETRRARQVQVAGYAKIPLNFDDFCRAMNAGHAIVLSGNVLKPSDVGKSNFAFAKEKGWLTFPKDWKRTGGHAFCHLIGYDRKAGYGILGNSYGEGYGYWKDGTMRISKEEIKNLNPSAYVIFIDEVGSKTADLMRQIRYAKAIYALAAKMKNAQVGNDVAQIQRAAHSAANTLRTIISKHD